MVTHTEFHCLFVVIGNDVVIGNSVCWNYELGVITSKRRRNKKLVYTDSRYKFPRINKTLIENPKC